MLFVALLLPLTVIAQSAPQHEQYVKIGSESTTWTQAYASWNPDNVKALYEGYDEDAAENEMFFISRVKPRERFVNSYTQVRTSQNPDRKLLWWCPIGGDGWNALPSYYFGGEVWSMWSYTDIWGNWTAPFVAIPASMLDVCHKNGVKISCVAPVPFNSIISPSSAGYGQMLNRMLVDGADKFIKYLKYYGVDGIGWNSEFSFDKTNKISQGKYSGEEFHTAAKLFFGDCYEAAEQYGVPFHNCWYSMMHNLGTMPSSSNLDGTNKDWFHYSGKPTSTAYFTNYGSDLATSQRTVTLNFTNRSSFDVFFGVDYQAGSALSQWKELNDYKISLGIWGAHNRNQIYEQRGERGSDPLVMQKTYQQLLETVFTGSTKNPVNPPAINSYTKFSTTATNAYGWAQYIVAKSALTPQGDGDLSTDPFVTYFNLGNGRFFNVAGERHANTEWYNIGMQDYMPTWRWWFTNTYMGRTEEEVSTDLTAEFTWDDAWFGGSCLQISGATTETYLQLFKTKYEVSTTDYVTIRYKYLSGTGTLAWTTSAVEEEGTLITKEIKDATPDENGWIKVETQINGRGLKINGKVMAQLGLKFTNTSDDFKILIGQISLTRGKVGKAELPITPEVKKVKMMSRNYKGVDMKIIFSMDHAFEGTKESYEPVYNSDVKTWYYKIYTQQEGCQEKVFTATTSWAAYVVSAPYNETLGGGLRIGVSAVSLDGEKESEIAWGDWFYPQDTDPVIVEGTEIDKPIIKANEEFTIKYIDPNHPAATWEIINSTTGASIKTFANTTSITMSLATEGSYDVKITNADGTVAYTRGIIQVSPASTGAIPTLSSFTANKTEVYKADAIELNYEISRKGEGSVSRAVKVEDPNMLRFPEVVPTRPYTYMMWFKVDKLNHSSQGTNLIDKRNLNDTWPHNNWGDFWLTIRPEIMARKETGKKSTTNDRVHPANEISFNTYGWTEHDQPNSYVMTDDHSVKEGQWTHIAVTYGTNDVQTLYFNGKKVAEATVQHIENNAVRSEGSSIYVGGTSVYKSGYTGWVDEFQVWDRVLTLSEIQTAMKGYSSAPSGLQGYWTFETTQENSEGKNVFPNLGQKGNSYVAEMISTLGAENGSTGITETVLDASNDELGNPMITGGYSVTTSAEWNLPNADVISTANKKATISYNAVGSYTAGLTLKNMWGSDTKSVDIVVVPYPYGVEESVVEEMGVYPNPFTDCINLSFVKEGAYTIEIVALDGKLIESKYVSVSANEIVRVDVNGDNGVYFVRVVADNGANIRTVKLIKK